MGSAVMAEASVSSVTASAPSSSPATDASTDAAKIRPGAAAGRIRGLNTSG